MVLPKAPSTIELVSKTIWFKERKSWQKDVDKKIPDTNGLVQKTDYNTKITEIENEIPVKTDLVTTAALNT